MSISFGLDCLVVKDRWLLKKKVGRGTFCDMYLARSILPFEADKPIDAQVAIKLQHEDHIEKVSSIRNEAEILKVLSGLSTTPRFIKVGKHENRDYMVMELLDGEDMAHLRDRIRAKTGLRCIALPGAVFLAQQMLKCIQNIHSKGFVHRDIKPANFIRRTQDSTDFVMVDFGITRQYSDQSSKNIKPERENCSFRGTAQYASPFAHRGYDQCPRDDLLGLVLVFFDLICGSLPWLEMVRIKDRQAVTDSKQTFFANPIKLTRFVHETAEAEMAKCPASSRYYNFPKLAQSFSLKIIEYLMALSYESVPDYGLINHWFSEMLDINERQVGHEMQWENIANPHYSYRGFSYGGGVNKRVLNTEPLSTDPEQIQDIAISAMRYLHDILNANFADFTLEERKEKEATKNTSTPSIKSEFPEDVSESEFKRQRFSAEPELKPLAAHAPPPPPPAPPSWAANSPIINSLQWNSQSSQPSAVKPSSSSPASGAASPRKDIASLDTLFPEVSSMSVEDIILCVWRGIVSHLCSVQIAHLKNVKISAIKALAEKHNFFLDEFPSGKQIIEGTRTKAGQSEYEKKIMEANAIFFKIDAGVTGLDKMA